MKKSMIRTYSKTITFDTFKDRLNYLMLFGKPYNKTFGSDRYLNQILYRSYRWKQVRRKVILRDKGCDLAMPDHPIYGGVYIHHLNPITADDLIEESPEIFDMDNLISLSFDTHQMIHYGVDLDNDLRFKEDLNRHPNDTCPWK